MESELGLHCLLLPFLYNTRRKLVKLNTSVILIAKIFWTHAGPIGAQQTKSSYRGLSLPSTKFLVYFSVSDGVTCLCTRQDSIRMERDHISGSGSTTTNGDM